MAPDGTNHRGGFLVWSCPSTPGLLHTVSLKVHCWIHFHGCSLPVAHTRIATHVGVDLRHAQDFVLSCCLHVLYFCIRVAVLFVFVSLQRSCSNVSSNSRTKRRGLWEMVRFRELCPPGGIKALTKGFEGLGPLASALSEGEDPSWEQSLGPHQTPDIPVPPPWASHPQNLSVLCKLLSLCVLLQQQGRD